MHVQREQLDRSDGIQLDFQRRRLSDWRNYLSHVPEELHEHGDVEYHSCWSGVVNIENGNVRKEHMLLMLI